ncbi:putative protein YTEU [Bacillus sp. ZZV12-4809]|nr:putative protein YTEU [Bacillus sp. ZZV12-4809]
MGFDGLIRKLYDISEWITRLMYVNLLWILFTLAGLGAAGFFPSTAAMFTVTRKWVVGEREVPVVKTFWAAYKQNFIQSNLIGYLFIIIGLILYVDLRFFQTSEQFIFQSFSFIILFLLIIYFICILYMFPVFVHFKFKTLAYVKYSFIIAAGRPLLTIFMVAGTVLLLILLKYLPILVLFIGGGLMSYVMMWIAVRAFPKEQIQMGSQNSQKV